MTPVAQQANLLVMGPGNYVFRDYMKAGALLSLLVFMAVMACLPLFFRT
jgi:di/tricarboxylate transporter